MHTSPAAKLTFSDRHVVWPLMAVAAVLFTIAAKLRVDAAPWGDEPHYLAMADAVGRHHSFGTAGLLEAYSHWKMEFHLFPGPNGVLVPLHNWGGPILWAIPYELWGRAGAAMVVVLVSVLTVGACYQLLRELGIVRPYAALVTGLFVVGSPLYMYCGMTFIEPFGALFVTYAARVLVASRPSRTQMVLASAGLGWLPWVHGRFTMFTVVLGLLLVLRVDRAGATGWRAVTAYLPAALPMTALFLGLELFNWLHYGSLSPAPGNANIGDGLLQNPPQVGLAGLLLDRQYGLLSHFPLLALALPGMLLAFRRRGPLPAHLMLLATIVPYVLAIATFRSWSAGWSPPARLLTAMTPLLAYYVAVVLQRLHGWLIPVVAAVLAAMFGFIYSVLGDVHSVDRYTTSGGWNDPNLVWAAKKLHHPDLPSLLPTWIAPEASNPWKWLGALAACAVAVWLCGLLAPAERIPARPLLTLLPTARDLIPPAWRRGRRTSAADDDTEAGKPDERPADTGRDLEHLTPSV